MIEKVELVTRILCDLQPKSPADGAYLYCQTKGNQMSTFQTAVFLIQNILTPKVLILREKEKSGYPGFSEWTHQLHQLGITAEQIELVKNDGASELNTLTESKALIRHARRKGYCSLYVVASPFQQLRAFMTAVTVSVREYPELLIYSYPGVSIPWTEEVTHSQGTLSAKRYELIRTELARIKKYQDKGDLASFEQVLNYLNRREKALFPATG
jgi:hypothetical protein